MTSGSEPPLSTEVFFVIGMDIELDPGGGSVEQGGLRAQGQGEEATYEPESHRGGLRFDGR